MGLAIPKNTINLIGCPGAASLTALFPLKAPTSIRGFRGFLFAAGPVCSVTPNMAAVIHPSRPSAGVYRAYGTGGDRRKEDQAHRKPRSSPLRCKNSLSYGLIHRKDGITF